MRINDIQVDGFGVWKGLKIDGVSDSITVFYGQNEAGKTTLMQFVRSIMFGYSPERRKKYIPPVYGGLAGGSLHVITPHSDYEIERHIDPNRITDPSGDLSVIDSKDGTVHGRATLGNVLNDVDESIFNNVFAIGLREIQELNTLNSTDAAEHLYKLTSGLDRVSLVDVMRDLRNRREAIWSTDEENPGKLRILTIRRRALLQEIDELISRSRRWSKIAVHTSEINQQLEDLEAELSSLENESKVLEVAIQIGDRWQARKLLDDQVEGFGHLPSLSDISVKELDRLNSRLVKHRERIALIKTQRNELRREVDQLPINRLVWSQAARIDAMCEHLPWIESMQRQIERLRRAIGDINSSIGGEVDGLGSKLNLSNKDIREIATRSFSALRDTGRKMLDHHEMVNKAQSEIERAKLEFSQFEDRLQTTYSATHKGIPGSIDDTGRLVGRLRRRIELEEKIEKLNHTRHELERDIDDVVNEQVLPVGKLTTLGLIFILGIIFAGFGLLSWWWTRGTAGSTPTEVGFLLMILGTGFGLFSLALKHHWERVAREELDDFRHQFDLVRQQLKRAKAERDEIERHLPSGVGEWDLQLREAEGQLARLEDLVPMENRCKTAKFQIEEAERHRAKVEAEFEQAKKTWRDTLRTVGLPETLQPSDIEGITQKSERISGFHSRLDQYKTELIERETELETISKRIDSLIEECDLRFESRDVLERIERLRSILGEQRRLVGSRKEHAAKYKSLRSTYGKVNREIEKTLGLKRKLLAAVGAETEDDYRSFHTKHVERRKLIEKRNHLTDQIAAALTSSVTEDKIADKMSQYGQAGLERRWEHVQAEIEGLKTTQTKLHQQRGEFLQEVKMLGEDSRLDEARMELSALSQQLNRLKREWQILCVSSHMLESIRDNYEAQRQPETLREASNYLERLTDGHYLRIWTRLSGEELLVDNHEGETLSVDLLSRGTREAVYLSLRLALVGAYARRGAVLPMVLDDVLVNFDSKRARAAAIVLKEFSLLGYQVMMFTCHDHIRDLFDSIDVDVRVLPYHKDVVESDAVPTSYRKLPTPPPVTVEVEEDDEEVFFIPPTRRAPVKIEIDEFDPELHYELTAIEQDQKNETSLQSQLTRAKWSETWQKQRTA